MLEKDRPFIYLKRVLESIDKINSYTKDIKSIQDLKNNGLVLDAVLMQLIHIGETINKFYKRYANKYHLNIPYENIIGFRNFVAHDYLGVNIKIVWNILQNELPKLKNEIEKFLKECGRF